jgi:hypothetical protein
MLYDPGHMPFSVDLIDLAVEVAFMVSRCFNPSCQAEFRALNSGSLYALERRAADTKFLWLCSACVPLVSLFINLTGSVALGPKLIASNPIKTVVCAWFITPQSPLHGFELASDASSVFPTSILAILFLRHRTLHDRKRWPQDYSGSVYLASIRARISFRDSLEF